MYKVPISDCFIDRLTSFEDDFVTSASNAFEKELIVDINQYERIRWETAQFLKLNYTMKKMSSL